MRLSSVLLMGESFRLTRVLLRLTKGLVSGLTGVHMRSVQSLYLVTITRHCVAILEGLGRRKG